MSNLVSHHVKGISYVAVLVSLGALFIVVTCSDDGAPVPKASRQDGADVTTISDKEKSAHEKPLRTPTSMPKSSTPLPTKTPTDIPDVEPTISPKNTPTPTKTPTSVPTETSTPIPDPACQGLTLGEGCWFMGEYKQSCLTVCQSRGGYDPYTETFSDHNLEGCRQLHQLFGTYVAPGPVIAENNNKLGLGCFQLTESQNRYAKDQIATPGASAAYSQRMCACLVK